MRIVVNMSDNKIIQVEGTASVGELSSVNGRYVIDVPAGEIPVVPSSYVLPVDGGDISSLVFGELLSVFPNFGFVQFNSFVDVLDVAKIDPNATVDNTGNVVLDSALYTDILSPRYQAGGATGIAANSTGLLPTNTTVTPAKPGMMVSTEIDLSPDLGGAPAEELLFYVRAYKFTTSHDISSDYNAGVNVTGGRNEPSIRTLEVIDPNNTPEFTMAVSVNGGGLYTPVKNLQPFTPCVTGDKVRVAFFNTGSDKIYIGAYAVLY